MSRSIDPAQFTINLGGKWHGSFGVAPCPVCQPEAHKHQNTLTLADGTRSLASLIARLVYGEAAQ